MIKKLVITTDAEILPTLLKTSIHYFLSVFFFGGGGQHA